MRRLLVLLLSLTLLTGCTDLRFLQAKLQRFEPTADTTRVELYNRFGFDLYRELAAEENMLISPLSIALALAMVYNGTEGASQAEMARILNVQDMDLDKFNLENQSLLHLLRGSDSTLDIANSVWVREGSPIKEEFVENLQSYYAAQAAELDFNRQDAVETMNMWVTEHTNDLIKQIVEGPIDPLTLMFLINAVYFKGDWAEEFKTEQMQDAVFQAPSGPVIVPFMHQSGSLAYLKNKDFQAVRLPYGSGRVAMYVFVPKNLSSFHSQLNFENWTEWLADFSESTVKLVLPKLELEYETELNEALQALGVQAVFDPEEANFGQMTDLQVYINQVKHKTFLKVDEQGTEAAAVTSVEVRAAGIPKVVEMIVDRPFFFAIHDSEADTILFMGSVLDPR